ncbi:MAG: hypothetical protein DRP64_10815 [Verrucomicrobia bacterium]|nr:MAG: hypothetical protein DRP64_10815 [Verrucomicrobiota bacterium]
MKIELLTIPHCPGAEGTRRLMRNVLRNTGESFTETEVENAEQAEELHFLGSPTIQIDGQDIEPARRNDPASFSCRTYLHGDQLLCQVPEQMLREALPGHQADE